MNCRFCRYPLTVPFVDLVNAPPSNAFLTEAQLDEPEVFYPLRVFVCDHCFLVQIAEYKKSSAIFDNTYAYFSSYSTSWLAHARRYVEMMIARFKLQPDVRIMEIASNDGYLLQYLLEHKYHVLGIEPTANTAAVALAKGIPTIVEFFGVRLARELVARGENADVVIGNNVLAHVPDINDFVEGLQIVLRPGGVITMEFPHLLRLMQQTQFDTIYHEHFSYLSFGTVCQIFAAHGLTLFDVEELPTHGGSLRIYAQSAKTAAHVTTPKVAALLNLEKELGMDKIAFYTDFQARCEKVKNALLQFLLERAKAGDRVAAYGAAAKGNTLLNYCGIKPDLLSFVVDKSPHKQGKYLPGCHVPVVAEDRLRSDKPAYVIIFPWNIKAEIMEQLKYIRDWGGRFVIPIPHLEIL
jgi:2-polyprenyl-3-methyl-5-hydroxy-6-metoxy-1,4-benzoquinol methylase